MISKEAKRAYDRKRYFNGKRQAIFQERRCRACGIRLAGKEGAKSNRSFCYSCARSGTADRQISREYYKAHREEILAKRRLQAYGG